MSYQLKSIDDLLAHINTLNGSSVVESDFTLSAPVATGGNWQGLTTTRNTAVKFTTVPASKYQGSVVVLYDRLDLSRLAAVRGNLAFSADHPATVADLLPNLAYFTGVRLTLDDVENSAVTDNGNGTYSATLTAKATSIGWTGSVAVTATQGGVRLDTAVVDNNLDGLNYPTNSDADVYGALYLYSYDFTAAYADLGNLASNAVLTADQASKVAAAINAVDISSGAGLWTAGASATAWSVEGATVVFNGLNASDKPTNPNYKYVLALQLKAAVTSPKGLMYLHYNDPVDPGAI